MATASAAHLPTSNNVCFAELIVRLDSLLTLKPEEVGAEEEGDQENEKKQAQVQLENDINLKLTELHLRLKNGGSIHDRGLGANAGASAAVMDEEDEEDEAVEDSQGPSSATEGPSGSIDCVGCSSAEDENEVCPSPIQAKVKQKKTSLRSTRLMNHDNTTAILRLCVLIFTKDSSTNETLALAAQLIAEMCREHDGRKMALQYQSGDLTLIQSLGRMLRLPRSTETCVQTCRIIGNLCFDCDQGRQQVITEAQHILGPLVKAFENREENKNEDPGQRLPVIFPGCLFNLCNETPKAVEAVARYHCADTVLTNILETRTNDAVFNSSILFLHSMVECEMGIEHLSRCPKLPSALIHVLDYTTSPEVCSTLFELLRTCSEAPALVLHLAKGGLLDYLLTHMNDKLNSEAFRQLRVTSCDILVILLAHDEAIKVVFEKDAKLYINTFLDWLKNGEDAPLKITAALCMGNFCSSKDNCSQLLSQFAPALIEALVEHQAPLVRDVKLQHAIMGALRNLAVATEGRDHLLQNGILLPCLDLMAGLSLTPITHPVVMKLLGTTRLLVDSNQKEVSLSIAEERLDVLAQIIAYGNHENAGPGPKAESGRLIAGLLKNCHSLKAMKNVMNLGGLPAVTVMLHSTHARMLNEALVSLTILSSTLAASEDTSDHDLLHRHLHTDLTINGVIRCLSNCDSPDGLKANAATFIKSLLQVHTQEFRHMLDQMSFCQECGLDQPDKLATMPKEVQDLAAVLL